MGENSSFSNNDRRINIQKRMSQIKPIFTILKPKGRNFLKENKQLEGKKTKAFSNSGTGSTMKLINIAQ